MLATNIMFSTLSNNPNSVIASANQSFSDVLKFEAFVQNFLFRKHGVAKYLSKNSL